MMRFSEWLKHRVAMRDSKLFDRGFNYAAGELLRAAREGNGEMEETLDRLDMEAAPPWDWASHFDKGIDIAVTTWRRRVTVSG